MSDFTTTEVLTPESVQREITDALEKLRIVVDLYNKTLSDRDRLLKTHETASIKMKELNKDLEESEMNENKLLQDLETERIEHRKALNLLNNIHPEKTEIRKECCVTVVAGKIQDVKLSSLDNALQNAEIQKSAVEQREIQLVQKNCILDGLVHEKQKKIDELQRLIQLQQISAQSNDSNDSEIEKLKLENISLRDEIKQLLINEKQHQPSLSSSLMNELNNEKRIPFTKPNPNLNTSPTIRSKTKKIFGIVMVFFVVLVAIFYAQLHKEE
ncbi:Uncharacterized protein QTN25_005460 [Entamoeba marina]